jgi:ribosomal protein L40E
LSEQIKFGLKNDAEAVFGSLNRKSEFYLVIQNHQGYYLPQVRVVLTGPPEIRIIIRNERYGGIGNGNKKSRLFSIIPRAEGIFTLTATLSSRNNVLLTIPIEIRVGNVQKPVQSFTQRVQPLPSKITKVNCPFCGEEIESDAKFCPICGSKLGDLQERELEIKSCSGCGHELPIDAKFCAKCGTKQI